MLSEEAQIEVEGECRQRVDRHRVVDPGADAPLRQRRDEGIAIQGIPVGAENFGPKVEQAIDALGDEELLELKVLREGRIISLIKPVEELI